MDIVDFLAHPHSSIPWNHNGLIIILYNKTLFSSDE